MIAMLTAYVLSDRLREIAGSRLRSRRLVTEAIAALVAAVVVWLLLGRWTRWQEPLVLLGVLGGTAGWPTRTATALVSRHAVRVTALLAALAWLGTPRAVWTETLGRGFTSTCVLLAGAIVAIFVCGDIVERAVARYQEEIARAARRDSDPPRGLSDGGRMIGRLERALILLFVLTGNPSGVGFLFAAKSILRFGDVKDSAHRMQAEYIIIGSLMSFGLGLAAAYGTRWLWTVS